jgi:hypothetical protein
MAFHIEEFMAKRITVKLGKLVHRLVQAGLNEDVACKAVTYAYSAALSTDTADRFLLRCCPKDAKLCAMLDRFFVWTDTPEGFWRWWEINEAFCAELELRGRYV